MDIQRIDVKQILRSKLGRKAVKIPAFVANCLARIIHQDELNEILTAYKDLQGVDFMRALVGRFRIALNIVREENLPPSDGRRYLFVSNHPLGGLDGICLSYLLGQRYQGKVKCLVNDLLLAIPNLRSIFVPVNKHGAQSKEAIRQINEAYRSDDQVFTFPAGLCSRKHKGVIRDAAWQKSFIQKAVEHERDVVPIYFDGGNSRFFYRFANLRKRSGLKINLEMLYLPNEMFKMSGQTFSIHIGKPVPWQTFDSSRKPAEWAEWMKEEVYKLAYK